MIVDDLIAMRFLSKPYKSIVNLRCGSQLIKPWLDKHRIIYSNRSDGVIFEPMSKLNIYTYLGDELIDYLQRYKSIVISELSKLDTNYSVSVRKFSLPLESSEALRLYGLTEKTFSFLILTKR